MKTNHFHFMVGIVRCLSGVRMVAVIGILSLNIGCSSEFCPFRSCSSVQPEYDFGKIVEQLPLLPEAEAPYPFPPLEGHENCKVTGDRAHEF